MLFLLISLNACFAYLLTSLLITYFIISWFHSVRQYFLTSVFTYLLLSYLLPVFMLSLHTSWHHEFIAYFLTSWLPDFAACLFDYFLILYLHARLQDSNYAFAYDFVTSITGLLITVWPYWRLYLQRLRLYRRFHIWLWIYVRLYSFIYDYAYDFAVQMRSIWSYCVKLLENM